MLKQEGIMAKLANATHITVVAAMSFYYQWLIHPDSRWAFTVVTHDSQYTFHAPILGYKGFNSYVQRRMDSTLRGSIADAYCDDIVIASSSFQLHILDLVDLSTRLIDPPTRPIDLLRAVLAKIT